MVSKTQVSKIQLNMIVKNEAFTILRCLESVKPYISHFCIVDTGSTDGTQDLIREWGTRVGIPGSVHDRPWQDFGTNRTEAIDLAMSEESGCEYIMVIDADDYLEVTRPGALDNLTADAYRIQIAMGGTTWPRTQIFKAVPGWKYIGVLHELLVGPDDAKTEVLPGVVMHASVSGPTREALLPEIKFHRDAEIFKKALETCDPEDTLLYTRYWFYMAQSYRDAKMWQEALEAYRKRAELGGWNEEVWYSLYMAARCLQCLEAPEDEVVAAYIKAWEFRPTRLEAPYWLSVYLGGLKRWMLAYTILRTAIESRFTTDTLFLETGVWQWALPNQWNLCLFHVGLYEQAVKAARALVDSRDWRHVPQDVKEGIEKNLKVYRQAVKDTEKRRRAVKK
jgi:tetratricopeptide (TPR) repeat protein